MEAARLVVPPAVQDEDIDDDNDTKTPFKDLQEEEQGSLSKVNIESLKPFASDPAKQKRFDLYIRFVELGHRGSFSTFIGSVYWYFRENVDNSV